MRSRNNIISILLLLSLLLFGFPQQANADGLPLIQPGVNPLAQLKAAVSFRNFNTGEGDEIYLGLAGLAVGNRTEVDFSGGTACDGTQPLGTWLPSNHVIFEYYPIPGKVVATVVASVRYCLEYPTGPLGKLDYIQIDLVNLAENTTVKLTNVKFNSIPDGSFEGTGNNAWNLSGQDFTLGFKLEGDLELSGDQPGGELNMLQFSVGEISTVTDTQGPSVRNLILSPDLAILNEPVQITATIDDSLSGNSTIASSEYSLDGGNSWLPMVAADGSYDNVVEEVSASFQAAPVTLSQVCVRGTDQFGNVGVMLCTKLSLTYRFAGFYQPIQMGVVHSAKAIQVVPMKWRLTDYFGTPIIDPASFTGLFSYTVNCSDFSGDPSQSAEEFATGKSGLQYTDGNFWRFNWETRPEYKGTCRAVYVRLLGGSTSPIVFFKFR